MTWIHGAGRNLERTVTTHLFVSCPNNSGSTFLQKALATCRATWNLPDEGHRMPGYRGPAPGGDRLPYTGLLWAASPEMIAMLADPTAYDWPRTRRAWYFQARAREARASVFVVKSPPHLLVVDDLARHFVNPKFLFVVRNPYAVCEAICRYMTGRVPHSDPELPEKAARHVVACLHRQRRNIEAHRSRGVFFTYELMCREPERVARRIQALVPALDDLRLQQRLRIKGHYDEPLTDMNAGQISRLSAEQVAAFNRVFREHRDALDYFGYALLEEWALTP